MAIDRGEIIYPLQRSCVRALESYDTVPRPGVWHCLNMLHKLLCEETKNSDSETVLSQFFHISEAEY